MFPLEVVPGVSVGPFSIGMPIKAAIDVLQKNIRLVRHVDFLYDSQDPLSRDWILVLVREQIVLRFDRVSQRLKSAEIRDAATTSLSYAHTPFSGHGKTPTFVAINHLFGPTYPGTYDDEGNYTLNYRGICFLFPIPPQYQSLCRETEDFPLEFPDGTTPVCASIKVYRGDDPAVPTLPPLPYTSTYYEEMVVALDKGVTMTKRNARLLFGTHVQDVLSDLGPPEQVFTRPKDNLVIHSSSDSGKDSADYFFNYYDCGLDVLFDGRTHHLKKLVLHTNLPGNVDFNLYTICNFRIRLSPEVIATPQTKWSEIEAVIGKAERPLLNISTLTNNPFGGTYFYGYRNVIFEVMKNGYIASVTIFEESSLGADAPASAAGGENPTKQLALWPLEDEDDDFDDDDDDQPSARLLVQSVISGEITGLSSFILGDDYVSLGSAATTAPRSGGAPSGS